MYNQTLGDCPTSDAADFRLDVRLDERNAPALVGSLAPGETWVGSVRVDAEGMLQTGAGRRHHGRNERAGRHGRAAGGGRPAAAGALQTGLLTSADPVDVFSFAASAGDVVSIDLSATSGSLDTLLQLLDSDGAVLAANDDLADGASTNSSVSDYPVLVDGDYRIVATRYGKEVGGTEGHYEILLTRQKGGGAGGPAGRAAARRRGNHPVVGQQRGSAIAGAGPGRQLGLR